MPLSHRFVKCNNSNNGLLRVSFMWNWEEIWLCQMYGQHKMCSKLSLICNAVEVVSVFSLPNHSSGAKSFLSTLLPNWHLENVAHVTRAARGFPNLSVTSRKTGQNSSLRCVAGLFTSASSGRHPMTILVLLVFVHPRSFASSHFSEMQHV